jgi:hypothetical protein
VVSALFTLRLAPARAMRRSALHTRHHPHSCCGANHARPATARVWSAAARGGSTPRVAQAQERLSERALREALCRGCACRAYFNYAGEPRGVFCAAHKADGMVDVVNKLCGRRLLQAPQLQLCGPGAGTPRNKQPGAPTEAVTHAITAPKVATARRPVSGVEQRGLCLGRAHCGLLPGSFVWTCTDWCMHEALLAERTADRQAAVPPLQLPLLTGLHLGSGRLRPACEGCAAPRAGHLLFAAQGAGDGQRQHP